MRMTDLAILLLVAGFKLRDLAYYLRPKPVPTVELRRIHRAIDTWRLG